MGWDDEGLKRVAKEVSKVTTRGRMKKFVGSE